MGLGKKGHGQVLLIGGQGANKKTRGPILEAVLKTAWSSFVQMRKTELGKKNPRPACFKENERQGKKRHGPVSLEKEK